MVVRLGIVGLSVDPSAWATLAHVKPLTSKPLSDEYKIVAVATSRKETALAAAKAYGVAEDKAYGNAESLAKDPDVDMVTISIKVSLVLLSCAHMRFEGDESTHISLLPLQATNSG